MAVPPGRSATMQEVYDDSLASNNQLDRTASPEVSIHCSAMLSRLVFTFILQIIEISDSDDAGPSQHNKTSRAPSCFSADADELNADSDDDDFVVRHWLGSIRRVLLIICAEQDLRGGAHVRA